MNGGQDLGGVQGFGPVVPEPDEPLFHAEWEKGAFALTLALGFLGRWNIDMSRFYRENRSPAEYYSSSYYALWFKALEKLVVDRGLVTEEERRTGKPAGASDASLTPPGPQRARELLALGIKEYRQAFFKPYRVIYRVIDSRVIIYVIADGRRDMQTVLARRLLSG